jgi:hypothetical protein
MADTILLQIVIAEAVFYQKWNRLDEIYLTI